MTDTQTEPTARTCRFPGCDQLAEAGEPGVGRPPEYCTDPGHNRGAAWRARQRSTNAIVADQARPVDAARDRASAITAQVVGMGEHLVSQLQELLTQLRTVGDLDAAQAQIDATSSEAAEQVAAAHARAVHAEQAMRKAISEGEEADAAALEANAQVEQLDAALAQVRQELTQALQVNQHQRTDQQKLEEELTQTRTQLQSSSQQQQQLETELAQLQKELSTAQGQTAAALAAQAEADQRAQQAQQRAQTAEQAATAVRQHLDVTPGRLGPQAQGPQRLVQQREAVATLTAERDAARAEVDRERAHADQRVADLHASYATRLADQRVEAPFPTTPAGAKAGKKPKGQQNRPA